jgi:hypothetical protein
VATRSEDVHIRNYDAQQEHGITIEVRTPENDVVLTKQYHLQPGETRSELDLLPNGEYELRVALDDGTVDALQCRIGDSADQTAVVELGNGVVAVTEGVYE